MKSDTKNHRSYGAAHGAAFGRSMMFGSRGPLLVPEDAGNGAGGAGGETTTSTSTTTTTGTPPTAAAGASGEKLLTQTQVNALIAQARHEGRESALKPQTTQTTTQPKATTPAAGEAQPMTAEAVQQLMQRERAFTRATATSGLNEKQLARMEAAFNAEKPADVATWSANYLEDMGFVKPSTTQTPNGTTTTVVTGTPPAAAPTVPSASNPMTSGGLTDIFNLSGDQIEQLGPQGMRAEFEKILTAGRRNSGAPPRPVMQRK